MKKGERTKTLILDDALALAGEVGLEGLSIGSLAGRLGLSKSGLFAHFGSKEDLQLATLQHGQRRFEATVFRPALAIPRGLPRLRALFDNWLDWIARVARPGGCVLLAAAMEYDDRPGPVREALVAGQRELRGAVAKAVRLAIQEAHLCSDTDPWQLAFEVTGILLAAHHDRGLLDDPRALNRARAAFERLIAAHVPVPAAA
ncbi:MAG: TetR/AcrR family transcriptional regulator [Burkholderiales bacterium]|jgi:AcrR family transcriptional regulator